MTLMNVFIEDVDREMSKSGTEPARKKVEKSSYAELSMQVEDELFRSYPSHAPVPYRNDFVILRMVKPIYPPDALADAREGYVLIEAYVLSDGTVRDVYVRSAMGPRSFEDSSIDAVKQFLFKPILENGRAIPFWVSFLVRFELRR